MDSSFLVVDLEVETVRGCSCWRFTCTLRDLTFDSVQLKGLPPLPVRGRLRLMCSCDPAARATGDYVAEL